MRSVLLDECVDTGLANALAAHNIQTVAGAGWTGLTNGELLRRAQVDFEVFVTTDRNLQHQQNLPIFDIAVIVLSAPTNRLRDLLPLAAKLTEEISSATPGRPVILRS